MTDRQTDKQNGMTIRLTLCERDAISFITVNKHVTAFQRQQDSVPSRRAKNTIKLTDKHTHHNTSVKKQTVHRNGLTPRQCQDSSVTKATTDRPTVVTRMTTHVRTSTDVQWSRYLPTVNAQ